VTSNGTSSGRLRLSPADIRFADQQAIAASKMSSTGSPQSRPLFSINDSSGKNRLTARRRSSPSCRRTLAVNHWPAYQLGEADFRVYFTHQVAQFRARLEDLINFLDLGNDCERLLSDGLAEWGTSTRSVTRLLPRQGRKNGAYRRGKHTTTPSSPENLSCRAVAGASAGHVGIKQANWYVHRDHVEVNLWERRRSPSKRQIDHLAW
jgi:hypothetical protein